MNPTCFVMDLFLLWFLYRHYNSLTQHALIKLCHQLKVSQTNENRYLNIFYSNQKILPICLFMIYSVNITKVHQRHHQYLIDLFQIIKSTVKWGLIGGVGVFGTVIIVATGGIAVPILATISSIVSGVIGGATGSAFKRKEFVLQSEAVKYTKEKKLKKLFKLLYPMFGEKKSL